MPRWSIIKLALVAVALSALVGVDSSYAAEFRYSNESITLTQRDQPKDAYLSSNSVIVDSPVLGDLVIFGNSIIINGSVEHSLFVAGGLVTIRGSIGRHLRVVGGTVTISGRVNGDLLVAGGTVVISDSAQISGDLLVAGGAVKLSGKVDGRTEISGGDVLINGHHVGVRAKVNKLYIGARAVISGDLDYEAPREATIDESAVITGATSYRPSVNPYVNRWRNFLTVSSILQLLGSVILALILIRFWPRSVGSIIRECALAKPWKAFGYGLVVIILVPIILLLLAASIVGLPLAMALGFLWLSVVAIGSVIGKLAVGHIFLWRLAGNNQNLDWRAAVLGVAGVAVLSLLPLVGLIISALVFIVGVGALARKLRYLKDQTLTDPVQ